MDDAVDVMEFEDEDGDVGVGVSRITWARTLISSVGAETIKVAMPPSTPARYICGYVGGACVPENGDTLVLDR